MQTQCKQAPEARSTRARLFPTQTRSTLSLLFLLPANNSNERLCQAVSPLKAGLCQAFWGSICFHWANVHYCLLLSSSSHCYTWYGSGAALMSFWIWWSWPDIAKRPLSTRTMNIVGKWDGGTTSGWAIGVTRTRVRAYARVQGPYTHLLLGW